MSESIGVYDSTTSYLFPTLSDLSLLPYFVFERCQAPLSVLCQDHPARDTYYVSIASIYVTSICFQTVSNFVFEDLRVSRAFPSYASSSWRGLPLLLACPDLDPVLDYVFGDSRAPGDDV